MPYKPSFGTIGSTGEPLEARKPDSPFRIAVLADFSGRQNRGETGSSADVSARRMIRVGRETLDEVMAKLGVHLVLPVGEDGNTIDLAFASLDDFHPDQIHDRVEQIADLYESDEKSALMNAVLHHLDFQRLEGAWRGLDWLLSRAVKGAKVEVMLLDVSLAELAIDLKTSENLTASGLHQVLIEKGVRGPRGEPWALVVANYLFELTGRHAELLGCLAIIASQTNAPLLTSVDPQVLDKSFTLSPDAASAWQELRRLPEAALLGLAVPRFLLRLPYGENTQSIDKFSFEEMSKPPKPSDYLWGNPAFGCAALLAQAFHKDGWALKPGAMLPLEKLPIHVYPVDGEEEVTLTEAWLVRPQPEQLVKQGIMPFLGVRGEGQMKLARFLSLAQPAEGLPACDLQGPWTPPGKMPAPRSSEPPAVNAGLGGKVPAEQSPTSPPAPAAPSMTAPPPKVEPTPVVTAPPPNVEPAPAPPVTASAPTVPAESPESPAEEEMDPDLAAMLKELEGG